MFESIIDTTAGLDIKAALICTAASVLFGAVAAAVYKLTNRRCSRSMLLTLIVLPAVVQAIIMLVNGSVGAGLAVMGTFSLVRFRSTPGSSKDIVYIFYAMSLGLATGMGYVGFAGLLALMIGAVLAVIGFIPGISTVKPAKLLRVVIPEDLDYNGVFDDIFKEYTTKHTLVLAKSTAMGTLFDVRYEIILKDPSKEKEMMDKIRCRNGNLTVSCGLLPPNSEEL